MADTFCGQCRIPLTPKLIRRHARFCSRQCRVKNFNAFEGVGYFRGLPSATVGAIAELAIARDLLARGFEVYRALSAACGADLVAFSKDGTLARFEVRTGYRKHNGAIYWSKAARDVGRSDHYAIVLHHTGEVFYDPPLTKGR